MKKIFLHLFLFLCPTLSFAQNDVQILVYQVDTLGNKTLLSNQVYFDMRNKNIVQFEVQTANRDSLKFYENEVPIRNVTHCGGRRQIPFPMSCRGIKSLNDFMKKRTYELYTVSRPGDAFQWVIGADKTRQFFPVVMVR